MWTVCVCVRACACVWARACLKKLTVLPRPAARRNLLTTEQRPHFWYVGSNITSSLFVALMCQIFLNVQIKDKRVSLNHLNNDRALTSAAMRQRGAVFGLMKGRAPKLNSNSFLKCQQDVTWSFCSLHAVSLMPVWCKRWQKRRFEAAGLALVQDSGYQSFSPGHFYVVFEFLHLPKFGLGLQVVGD